MMGLQHWVRIVRPLFVLTLITLLEYNGLLCSAQSFNITPITIQSVYEMNGETCIIQEAAFSTDESTRKIQQQMEAPFNSSLIPDLIPRDEIVLPSPGSKFTSAFQFEQNCSEDDNICTLKLKLTKSLCGNTADESSTVGQHFIKYTNVHASGISFIKILTDTGETMKEVTGENLAYSGFYGQQSQYQTSTVEFQYNISDPLHFGFDFIVDACCVAVH